MRAWEDWASPTCTLCFRERCLGCLMVPTICITSLPWATTAAAAGKQGEYHPLLHWQKKETRASSSTITPGRLPIEHGCRPAHWWEHCTLTERKHTATIYSTRQDHARLPAYYDPRADWTGICWTDAGISCLCAGSPTTALPLVRRFPPQHRTTAPVRQAQAAKPQCPVG